jgi:phage shock protein A
VGQPAKNTRGNAAGVLLEARLAPPGAKLIADSVERRAQVMLRLTSKLFWVAGGLALLAALFFGRDAVSYIGTSIGKARQMVKDSVNIEFEIDRARNMIKGLDPEIRRNKHLIAKEEAEIERLEHQVATQEAQLTKGRENLMRLNSDLQSSDATFEYCGHTYTREQVQADVERRFARFKTQDATLANLHKVLHARKRAVEAARQKLEGMMAAKRQLVVDVENLEARLKMVEVAQSTSEFNFDESHLARTKELIGEIHARIDVAEKLVDSETYFHDEIPLEDDSGSGDISQEVAEYFGARSTDIASAGSLPK